MHVAKLHGRNTIPGMADEVFDLSEYVRVGKDEGLVIDDTDFLAPQFGDTPLAEGQPLLAVTAGLQEKAYALGLNDATAAACVALQQALTWHVGQNGPLTLEEQQEGGSAPVWFDVQFARFEPDTNVRQAARGWRLGVLRVWVSPYGTTGTSRLVASQMATGMPVLQTGPIGGLVGDVPALVDVSLRTPGISSSWRITGGNVMPNDGQAAFVAVLPHASYVAYHPASEFVFETNSGLDANGFAVASGAFPLTDRAMFTLNLQPASIYVGRHRVLALAESPLDRAGVAFRAFGIDRAPLGPTALATAIRDPSYVDLGVLNVPTGYQATSVPIRVHAGHPTPGDDGLGWPSNATAWLGPPTVQGLIVVPEDDVSLVLDARRRAIGQDPINPAASGPLNGAVDALGNPWATTSLATAGGLWTFPGSQAYGYDGVAGNYHPSQSGFVTLGNELQVTDPGRDMRIEAIVSRGSLASCVVTLVKSVGSNSYARAQLEMSPTSALSARFSLSVVDNGATVFAVASQMAVIQGTAPIWFALQNTGPFVQAVVDRHGDVSNAWMWTGSAACMDAAGKPAVLVSDTIATQPNLVIGGVRVTSVASTPADANQMYRFEGVSGQVSRSNPTGVWQVDVGDRTRGAIPKAPVPTLPPIAIGAAGLSGQNPGFNSSQLSVSIKVRERFTFLR